MALVCHHVDAQWHHYYHLQSLSPLHSLHMHSTKTSRTNKQGIMDNSTLCHKLFTLETRSSAITRDQAMHYISWNLDNCCTDLRGITFEEACNERTSLKVTQGHWKWYDSVGHISLLLVVCSNSVSVLRCFRDITTFTVYVTASDLEKCFSLRHDSWNYSKCTLSALHTIIL